MKVEINEKIGNERMEKKNGRDNDDERERIKKIGNDESKKKGEYYEGRYNSVKK